MLSLLGGAILLEGGASLIIMKVLGWAILISATWVVAAVVSPMAVGVFFGYYPARKTARLDPIRACASSK